MVQRLSYRRQNSYSTRSNRVKVVKTPGGSLAYIYTNKKAGAVKCGDCGCALNGVRRLFGCINDNLTNLYLYYCVYLYLCVSCVSVCICVYLNPCISLYLYLYLLPLYHRLSLSTLNRSLLFAPLNTTA